METKSHLALYRKWRPQTFDRVWGQEHITSVLKYETAHNRISHAYLFCGSRGTGKTTCAKILAKAVNCLNPQEGNPCGVCVACRSIDSGTAVDVLEMDAASNNGVDNIRDIRDEVVYTPSALKFRVYIIDEVHMLSPSAFNALLKTLEEPPSHVIFILATTELHKLPATIISRCQRFDFRRITISAITGCLYHIAKGEGITLEPDAARLIARLAQGGMRDAISLLELCAGGGRGSVSLEDVSSAVGTAGREKVVETATAVARANYDAILTIISEIYSSSRDISVFWQDLISFYRDMLIMKTASDAAKYLDLTDSETTQLSGTASLFSKETLLAHTKLLEDALASMQKSGSIRRTIAELTLIRMSDGRLDTTPAALLSRLSRLEDMLRGGTIPQNRQAFTHTAAISDDSECGTETGSARVNADYLPDEEFPGGDMYGGAAQTGHAVQPGESCEATFAQQGNADTNKTNPPAAAHAATDTAEGAGVVKQARSAGTAGGSRESSPKKTLRLLRAWVDIIDGISRTSQPLAALLSGSRAYVSADDGRVIIRFENEFAMSMIERGPGKETIRMAVSSELGRELREGDMVCEVVPKNRMPREDESIFDELENNNI